MPIAIQEPGGRELVILPPATTQARLSKAGIDISKGYPFVPKHAPEFVSEVYEIRKELRQYVDPATRADPQKRALFGAAKEVRHIGVHLGTEIVGLQLKDLTNQQRDELALLVAERSVVFFRDQDISPQQQRELGVYLGDGEIEIHPNYPQVPGLGGGLSLIWPEGHTEGGRSLARLQRNFRLPYGSGVNSPYGWHTDLVHEAFPPAYTHLHQDAIPEIGGDTLWASGYAAYDKLSPKFRTLIDGLNGIYRSANAYKDDKDPNGPLKYVTRVHPLVRTNAATGWKSLFVNRAFTVGIQGLDKSENLSDAILNHLLDVYERSTDIQVRWQWTPGTSAIWDNRSTIHTVSLDWEGWNNRHGTRVSSLAEKPYFDPQSQSRRDALNLGDYLGVPGQA
ncbi:hypothetical protein BCR39DRAFT_580176 [Naematelia encephala]|uniref:TauD/TfdA-like domain-containing protein n=1 Tax=Naematelia encephala TaxID=71784 RepID=A0A1Y2AS98_9TREE|nr:hypothetical protein BCR39DRAFT_580176 [Naematelia encephala]